MQESIDARPVRIVVLLDVWPVPEGHEGRVVDPQTKAQDWVELKHLIEARQLSAGDVLVATHRDFGGVQAIVTADGHIEPDGKRFSTPSGAARQLRKKATNGWYFWSLPDGRRLRDVRAVFLSGAQSEEDSQRTSVIAIPVSDGR